MDNIIREFKVMKVVGDKEVIERNPEVMFRLQVIEFASKHSSKVATEVKE
ncbi:MAG: hypothetical protein JHC31_15265 [Sulfurihydrogenibium sp.]|nr:hypothetical protein [Sulfurihydrogenibium sp.]